MAINYQTLVKTGSFVSDGTNKVLEFPNGIGTITVYNRTNLAASQTTPVGVEFYWQNSGFAQGSALVRYKSNAASATNLDAYVTTGGFTEVDTSYQQYGVLQSTITAISGASIPVVTNTGTNGLIPGQIVRLINVTGAQQLSGIDFTVGYNTLSTTTFSLDYMAQIVSASGAGSFIPVDFDPMYYPSTRVITKITKAAQAVITLSVTHGYKVGQQIRLNIPAEFGMVELNGLQAAIVAVDTTTTSGNTITIDVDTTSFTTFAWPLTATPDFTPAIVVPIGQNSPVSIAEDVSEVSGAKRNVALKGVMLTGGANMPGGQSGDVIAWRAETVVEVVE